MTTQSIADILARLTYNGAENLRATAERPSPEDPDRVNGGERIYTGTGKWTHIAAVGVERHLISMGLAHIVRDYPNGPYSTPFEYLNVTPLGREVASHVAAHWESLRGGFRTGVRS